MSETSRIVFFSCRRPRSLSARIYFAPFPRRCYFSAVVSHYDVALPDASNFSLVKSGAESLAIIDFGAFAFPMVSDVKINLIDCKW